MEGIFLAYHNTSKIFGFQYVSQDEMDDRLFGGKVGGGRAFKMVIGLAEKLLLRVTQECWTGEVRYSIHHVPSLMIQRLVSGTVHALSSRVNERCPALLRDAATVVGAGRAPRCTI